MKVKHFGLIALAAVLMIGCIKTTAKTAWIPEKTSIHLEEMACIPLAAAVADGMRSYPMPRAYGTVDFSIAPKRIAVAEEGFSLDAGDIVTLNCTYTPKAASVDIGLVAPGGYFYYVNNTTGSIDASIEVSARGTYTLAVRNNSLSNVSITGSVNY